MSSLFGSLSIALRSMMAQQGAIGVTTNNIANINTPGYARETAVLLEESPLIKGSLGFGNGVVLSEIRGVRDRVLEMRINQETQRQSSLESYVSSMQQAAAVFNETQGIGLQNVIDGFFNSVQSLSGDPTSIPLRQGVISAGKNMTAAFQATAENLQTIRTGIDRQVGEVVGQVNTLTSQVAELNKQIASLQGLGQGAEQLIDQRNVMVKNLAQLVDVSATDPGDGSLTVVSGSGAALVVGTQSFALNTSKDPTTGMTRILSQGNDVTANISGGQLAGIIKARDQDLPSLSNNLDDLAAGIITSVNATHSNGFDLNGNQGTMFFTPFTPSTTGSNAGAAATFAVQVSDPSLVAASSDGSPGSSGNLTALAGLRSQAIVNGKSIGDFYSGMVFSLGNEISNATAGLDAQALVLQQLDNQRNAVSGVSMDEEAANLIRYQRAFEAAARVVNVVDQLTQTIIETMGR